MEGKKRKIMIVEDNEGLQQLMKIILEKRGYETLLAENGQQALNYCTLYDDIEVILLDLMMPKVNGEQFLELFSHIDVDSRPKVCVLSAQEDIKTIKRCLKMGAHDYLIKPLDKEKLIDKIKILTKESREKIFAEATTKIEGKILLPESYIPIEIKAFNENEIHFSSKQKIPLNAKVHIQVDNLENILNLDGPFLARVYESFDSSSGTIYKSTLIGIPEITADKLRALAQKGDTLDEE